jgi:hypothetical protein
VRKFRFLVPKNGTVALAFHQIPLPLMIAADGFLDLLKLSDEVLPRGARGRLNRCLATGLIIDILMRVRTVLDH